MRLAYASSTPSPVSGSTSVAGANARILASDVTFTVEYGGSLPSSFVGAVERGARGR
jgi:hypothetical protein